MNDTLPEIREGLVVRPGDRLVVTVDKHTMRDQVLMLSQALEERLPGVEVTVVGGVEQITVIRSGEETT